MSDRKSIVAISIILLTIGSAIVASGIVSRQNRVEASQTGTTPLDFQPSAADHAYTFVLEKTDQRQIGTSIYFMPVGTKDNHDILFFVEEKGNVILTVYKDGHTDSKNMDESSRAFWKTFAADLSRYLPKCQKNN